MSIDISENAVLFPVLFFLFLFCSFMGLFFNNLSRKIRGLLGIITSMSLAALWKQFFMDVYSPVVFYTVLVLCAVLLILSVLNFFEGIMDEVNI